MQTRFFNSVESYIYIFYVAHIGISLALAFALSHYISQRFVKSRKKIDVKDKQRLEDIALRSKFFRLLSHVSLHKNNQITNIAFIFLFNLSMPIIGYPFSAWVMWYLKHITYQKKVLNTNILNLDEFGMSFLKVERIFGEGSLAELMTSKYAPRSKKLKALSALSNNMSPENLKIIRDALTSTDDEIRMFGYAILNKTEKSLSVKISNNLNIFNQQKDAIQEEKAHAAQELAFLYWELVYTEISHESLKRNFLQEVTKYVGIAKNLYQNDIKNLEKSIDEKKVTIASILDIETDEASRILQVIESEIEKVKFFNENIIKLCTLMGRVYMSEKKYDEAKTEFSFAQELYGDELPYVLPYLAEIFFLTGQYKIVSSIMNQSKDLGLNTKLHPIVEQWKVS